MYFQKIRITQIVAFDSKFIFGIKRFREKLKRTEYFSESPPNFKPFSRRIYDYEYAKKNTEKIVNVESQVDYPILFQSLKNHKKKRQKNFIKEYSMKIRNYFKF